MGRHSAKIVSFRLGVVPQKPEEDAWYFSRDIQFDWPEGYEPSYPLTDAERKLQDLNREEMMASEEWVKAKTRDIVNEELTRAAATHLDHKNVRGDKGCGSQE